MRLFYITCLFFIFSLAFYITAIEVYCRTQTTFAIKKDYHEANLSTTAALILGSGHNQNAINPEFLSAPSSNLSLGNQPLAIDFYLLNKYIEHMPVLKTVFIEIAHHSFYTDLLPSEWNGHLYSNMYDIKYNAENSSLKNQLFVCSDYRFFSSIFRNAYNPNAYHYQINKFGFITNDNKDRFEKQNYDTTLINNTFIMYHTFTDQHYFNDNVSYLKKIIKQCQDKKIKVVLITPPFWKTYLNSIPTDVKKQMDDLLKQITKDYNLAYFNYSTDSRFSVYDFKNDNHMNSNGAKKFSLILNKEILQ